MSYGEVEKFDRGELVLWRSLSDRMLGHKPRPVLVMSQYRHGEGDGIVVLWADTLVEQDVWPVFPEHFVRPPAGNDE